MRHAYTPAALVHDPSRELQEMIRHDPPLRTRWKITRTGVVVVRLKKIQGGESNYQIPPELASETVLVQLQACEYGLSGHYVYVVADAEGAPIKPYAVSRDVDPSEWHGSLAHFSAASISRVGWFLGPDGARLCIDRASIEVNGDVAAVSCEDLLDGLPVDAPPDVPTLPASVSAWQEAVTALYERLCCKEGHNGCRGHYVV